MEIPLKINIGAITRSSKATYGYLSQGNETNILKRYLQSHVPFSLIYNSQDTEAT
jgi:hypothetical protein